MSKELQMDVVDERFKQAVFAVRATECEQGYLKEKFRNRLEWVDDENTLIVNIGETSDGQSLDYIFSWSKINGKMVMFYRAVSNAERRDRISKWIDGIGIIPRCDALNFHHVVIHVTDNKGLS